MEEEKPTGVFFHEQTVETIKEAIFIYEIYNGISFSVDGIEKMRCENFYEGSFNINKMKINKMKYLFKRHKKAIMPVLPFIDVCAVPFLFPTAFFFRMIRCGIWVGRFKLSQKVLNKVGVFPIRDHYYDPQFKFDQLQYPLDQDRNLPTIDFNDQVQLRLLKAFSYEKELSALPLKKTKKAAFFYDNESFESGDAEYLYNIIRHFRPKRMIEIGSGNSTLMAREAIAQNMRKDSAYRCDHICIEPYEMPWLESVGVKVLRKKVEDIDPSFFDVLQENDILFIDSSHMVRPQGDVLFEYLEILPRLKKGVLIHIHDIFTPRNYPESWLAGEVRLWNEQYLLEAFLSYNDKFEILGALNYLSHHYRKQFAEKCPIFKIQDRSEPASLWMRRKID